VPRGRANLRKGEFAFTKDLSHVRGRLLRLGIAASVLLALGLVLGIARLSSLHRQAAEYDDALCTATRRILGTCLTDYRQAIAQPKTDRTRDTKKVTFAVEFPYACSGEVPGGA